MEWRARAKRLEQTGRKTAVRFGLDAPPDTEKSFLHWLKFGAINKVCPLPWFKEEEYLQLNEDLRSYPEWVFMHFVRHGIKENRQFHPSVVPHGA